LISAYLDHHCVGRDATNSPPKDVPDAEAGTSNPNVQPAPFTSFKNARSGG
jgi:hypothetical protein